MFFYYFSGMYKLLLVLCVLVCGISAADAQRLYDGSGRQIGRVDGLRHTQCISTTTFYNHYSRTQRIDMPTPGRVEEAFR